MTGQELSRQMAAIELTADGLAKELDRHRDEVDVWLASQSPLPKKLARELEYVLAWCGRERLITRSGIPVCSWREQHEDAEDAEGDPDALLKLVAEMDAHLAACPTCQRRKAYEATLPPLPPWGGLSNRIFDQIERLPAWARPGAIGALLIGGLTLLRAMLSLAFRRVPLSPRLLLTVLAAVGVGAFGGLLVGVPHMLVRSSTRRFGRLGDYITGIVCVYAYIVALMVTMAFFTKEDMFRSEGGLIALLIIGTAFGLIVGHTWFRSPTPVASPSPRSRSLP